jgi:hypothetical protein
MDQGYQYGRRRERIAMAPPRYADAADERPDQMEEHGSADVGIGLDWLLAILLVVLMVSLRAVL